jgi:hypothetical protein
MLASALYEILLHISKVLHHVNPKMVLNAQATKNLAGARQTFRVV